MGEFAKFKGVPANSKNVISIFKINYRHHLRVHLKDTVPGSLMHMNNWQKTPNSNHNVFLRCDSSCYSAGYIEPSKLLVDSKMTISVRVRAVLIGALKNTI